MTDQRPIRILHVLTSMNYGGAETLLMTYYRHIDKSKVQFDFALSSQRESAFEKEILSMGGKIYRYPKYKITNHFQYIKWWKDFLSSHPEYDIVHGHLGGTAALFLSVAKRNGCYCIAHSHNTRSKATTIRRNVYIASCYPTRFIADYFFGCSYQAIIDRFGKKVAHNHAISSVMNNAIDTRRFVYDPIVRSDVRNELHIDNSLLVLGTVGRMAFQKNPQMIVRIVKQLTDQNEKFLFIWVGKGPMELKIREEVSRMGIDDKILFLGNRPDVNRVLQAMDVFLFPSINEGLGIACVEAQAAGLPTLCSDAVPEEAKVTDLFKYLPLSDVQAWTNAVRTAKEINRKNMFDMIVEAGYDIEKASLQLQCFYLSIAKKK